MEGRRRAAIAVVVVLLGCLGACAGSGAVAPGGSDEAVEAPMPDGLTAYLDQSRFDRIGRQVFVRLVNDVDTRVRVTHAVVSSPRFATVEWSGEEEFANETDLDFDLPSATCGTGSDAEVTLTYTVDDGPVQVSTTTATDRYGAIALFLDRDCAASALSEAATVTVGEPRVVGRGDGSVLELPVTFAPTGERDDVVVRGFENTVLFAQTAGSASVEGGTRIPLGVDDPARTVLLRVIPGRCDPHALAEDKVGTLFPIEVTAPEVPAGTRPYLEIGDDVRAALRGFVPTHCGW